MCIVYFFKKDYLKTLYGALFFLAAAYVVAFTNVDIPPGTKNHVRVELFPIIYVGIFLLRFLSFSFCRKGNSCEERYKEFLELTKIKW